VAGSVQLKKHKRLFDVIMMDPPFWSVGLDLRYHVLTDAKILSIPFELPQPRGYLMV
jgi:23S rRNA G2069 N7-methylase RlmK/C1962 C5-methylase RlmI